MRPANSFHTISAPFRLRPAGTVHSQEPSADLKQASVKLYDGLRDLPEIRQLIFSILDAPDAGQPPICPNCGRPLDPDLETKPPPLEAIMSELQNRKPKR